MADIFREVDEELQQERAATLWKKYGGWVIAVAVAIVLGVAGNVFWSQYEASQRAEQAAALDAALSPLQDDSPERAAEALAGFADSASSGYAMVARFQQAAALVDAADVDGAIAAYAALLEDEATPELYRDLALMKSVRLRIGQDDGASLVAELEPVLAEDSPWRPLARETEAIIALQAGDTEAAKTILDALVADGDTPPGLRGRASELSTAIGE